MSEKLKPCPFCGGEVTIEDSQPFDVDEIYYSPTCTSAIANIPCPGALIDVFAYESKEDLIKYWNERTAMNER